MFPRFMTSDSAAPVFGQVHLSGVGAIQPGQNPQKGRFADAIWPYQPDFAIVGYVAGDASENISRAIRLTEVREG